MRKFSKYLDIILVLWLTVLQPDEVKSQQAVCADACNPPSFCDHDLYMADPNNCSVYYRCVFSEWNVQICGDELKFDSKACGCNHDFIDECQESCPPTSPSPTKQPGTCDNLPTPCEENRNYADVSNCRYYYTCRMGQLERRLCQEIPAGVVNVFDIHSETCRRPDASLDCNYRCITTVAPTSTTYVNSKITFTATQAQIMSSSSDELSSTTSYEETTNTHTKLSGSTLEQILSTKHSLDLSSTSMNPEITYEGMSSIKPSYISEILPSTALDHGTTEKNSVGLSSTHGYQYITSDDRVIVSTSTEDADIRSSKVTVLSSTIASTMPPSSSVVKYTETVSQVSTSSSTVPTNTNTEYMTSKEAPFVTSKIVGQTPESVTVLSTKIPIISSTVMADTTWQSKSVSTNHHTTPPSPEQDISLSTGALPYWTTDGTRKPGICSSSLDTSTPSNGMSSNSRTRSFETPTGQILSTIEHTLPSVSNPHVTSDDDNIMSSHAMLDQTVTSNNDAMLSTASSENMETAEGVSFKDMTRHLPKPTGRVSSGLDTWQIILLSTGAVITATGSIVILIYMYQKYRQMYWKSTPRYVHCVPSEKILKDEQVSAVDGGVNHARHKSLLWREDPAWSRDYRVLYGNAEYTLSTLESGDGSDRATLDREFVQNPIYNCSVKL